MSMHRVCLFAVVAVGVIALIAAPAQAYECSSYTNCTSCTFMAGCGWCSSSEQCQDGTADGSNSGCVKPNWYWFGDCPAPTPVPPPTPAPTPANNCAASTGCASCTGQPTCGYCEASKTCLFGNASSSYGNTCSGSDWKWRQSDCPATHAPAPPGGCGQYASCYLCAVASGCGWCTATAQCQNGDSNGPYSGTCSSWAWSTDTCPPTHAPAPPGGCGQYGDCASCTWASGCGFCVTTSQCESGNSAGPYSGSCPAWSYSPTSCPPTPAPAPPGGCGQFKPCEPCADEPGCGWCQSSSQCLQGGTTGPVVGTCANWTYLSQYCPSTEETVKLA